MTDISSVLVLGGGITGIQAALDLAESGIKTYLIESTPSLGGKMAQLDKTFPTNDCAMCILSPKLVDASRHPNINLMVNSEITEIEGEIGDFKVKVLRQARFVDEDKCTACGLCATKCPKKVLNPFEQKFSHRKAIYIPFPQAVPLKYTIDKENCLYFTRQKCGICEKICPASAPNFNQKDEEITLNVNSIIFTPGYKITDATKLEKYGYGIFPNVITSLEFERILSASGPTGGKIRRPSDGSIPESIAFIQCVGSRDRSIGHPYCSSVCCMISIKEAMIAKEQYPETRIQIFFMDMRAFGKEFDEYYMKAEKEHKIIFTRNNRISGLKQNKNNRNIEITYIDEGQLVQEEFDLIVLSVGMYISPEETQFFNKMNIDLNQFNFCLTDIFAPLATSREGILVAGAFSEPKDIPESVAQASGSASKVIEILTNKVGHDGAFKYIEGKSYPEERDVSEAEPRIGVFVCHCGINIGGVVDVPNIVEYAKKLSNVVYAGENIYTCSQDIQELIKDKIAELDLNRIIVAACTPRTHETLFQNTLQEAGLNPYLFEMCNIRDQCSWVHKNEREKATDKAKDLVRMAVRKARLIQPLSKVQVEVTPSALIVGGGISGMRAALDLASYGFETHLVEKTGKLGGLLKDIHFTLQHNNVQEFLKNTIDQVESSEIIHVHKNSEIVNATGYIGNFNTTIKENNNEFTITHGIVIIATGGEGYSPKEYLFNEDPNIITQLEFEKQLVEGKDLPNTVVMIQCVVCRNEERPYCSRICCTESIKNALKLKELNQDARIYIIFKDMRTYGFRELYYEMAAEKGIQFIRYYDDSLPIVKNENELEIIVHDHFINDNIILNPDLIVLAVATLPSRDNEKLSKLFKIPLSKDKFFLEAHMKLRPLDFNTDGIFLAGLAHSPKFLEECLTQASGAAARAATILSKKIYKTNAMISVVDVHKCRGCGECVELCEFHAPALVTDETGRTHSIINEALCKGCGACAANCCNNAVITKHFTNEQIMTMINSAIEVRKAEEKEYEPFILAFCCNWCSYAGADLAGVSRFQYPPNARIIRVMCSGRIAPSFILNALYKGVDGILVTGCHPGDCHYVSGNEKAKIRIESLKERLKLLGIEEKRVRLEWISASEGKRFADIMNEFVKEVKEIGPNPYATMEIKEVF
ncbi:MAG: hydrogenase iron-sulfur subunit [Thermoplasmata archaeon]|nr:MAG: hydrogenase iron-sulfur subunit [Thermoplasmata archaeon]